MQVSTFNDTDEAITKIRGGNVDYDLYFPSYDQISRLINGGLVRSAQPQLHPQHQERRPFFTNPFYDQEWRYTVPYTVYTTGIGWRNDQVPADIGALKNPYDSLWGSGLQEQDRRHRRLAHRDGHGAAGSWASPT